MTYEEFARRGWKYAASETASKYFTSLEQHKRGKLLHNLKWGFPPKRAAADPQWLAQWIKENGPFMYHATDADAAKAILNEGLYSHDHGTMPSKDDVIDCPHCGYSSYRDDFNEDDPGYCPDCGNPVPEAMGTNLKSRSPWAGGFMEPRPGHSYLGTEKYAAPYAQNGGHVLKIDLRKLDPSLMDADEDHFEHANKFRPTPEHEAYIDALHAVNPPPLASVNGERLGEWADRAIGGDPEATMHSMRAGSMAYNGIVPPEAISLHGQESEPEQHAGWDLTQDPGAPVTAATDANNWEAKMYHGNNKGLLRDIKTPFVTTDKPTDHPISHEVSVTFRRPAHHFAPVLTPDMIDAYQQAGHDGIVAHRPDSTWAIALDPGTVVPGFEHEFPY